MFATIPFITVGAGRQSKTTSSLNIDIADSITGLFLRSALILPHSRTAAAAVFKKRKRQVAMKITKDKRSLLPNAGMEYMQRLLHHSAFLVAVREANEKARQELKTSTVDFSSNLTQFLQYIGKAWEDEISETRLA